MNRIACSIALFLTVATVETSVMGFDADGWLGSGDFDVPSVTAFDPVIKCVQEECPDAVACAMPLLTGPEALDITLLMDADYDKMHMGDAPCLEESAKCLCDSRCAELDVLSVNIGDVCDAVLNHEDDDEDEDETGSGSGSDEFDMPSFADFEPLITCVTKECPKAVACAMPLLSGPDALDITRLMDADYDKMHLDDVPCLEESVECLCDSSCADLEVMSVTVADVCDVVLNHEDDEDEDDEEEEDDEDLLSCVTKECGEDAVECFNSKVETLKDFDEDRWTSDASFVMDVIKKTPCLQTAVTCMCESPCVEEGFIDQWPVGREICAEMVGDDSGSGSGSDDKPCIMVDCVAGSVIVGQDDRGCGGWCSNADEEHCLECAMEFMKSGGCAAMSDDVDVDSYIPEGCSACGAAAAKICGFEEEEESNGPACIADCFPDGFIPDMSGYDVCGFLMDKEYPENCFDDCDDETLEMKADFEKRCRDEAPTHDVECKLPEGVTEPRGYLMSQIKKRGADMFSSDEDLHSCRRVFNRVVTAVVSGDVDAALLFNSSVLAEVCVATCPLNKVLEFVEEMINDVTDEMCGGDEDDEDDEDDEHDEHCHKCAIKFKKRGGCEAMGDDGGEAEGLIPEGCFECGAAAARLCGFDDGDEGARRLRAQGEVSVAVPAPVAAAAYQIVDVLDDAHMALHHAMELHEIVCMHDDDDDDDDIDVDEEEDDDDEDDHLCMGHLAALDAKHLCESSCATKMFSSFDTLFSPLFGETSKPSDILNNYLCSFVEDAETGGKHYCADLLADIEAASDADAILGAAPALCMLDSENNRPCLDAAKAIVHRFGKGDTREHGFALAENLCVSPVARPGDKVRTSIETPLTTTDELTADEERDLCDRVAAEVREKIKSELGLSGADVTVVVTIRRSDASDSRRLTATSPTYILSTDLVSSSESMPSADSLFDSCVKPAVETETGKTASLGETRTVGVPSASFTFDGGDDLSQQEDGDGDGKDEEGDDDDFLFGFSKRTVYIAGAGAAGLIVLAVGATFVHRRKKRSKMRRQSFRLESNDPAVPTPAAVVGNPVILCEKV